MQVLSLSLSMLYFSNKLIFFKNAHKSQIYIALSPGTWNFIWNSQMDSRIPIYWDITGCTVAGSWNQKQRWDSSHAPGVKWSGQSKWFCNCCSKCLPVVLYSLCYTYYPLVLQFVNHPEIIPCLFTFRSKYQPRHETVHFPYMGFHIFQWKFLGQGQASYVRLLPLWVWNVQYPS